MNMNAGWANIQIPPSFYQFYQLEMFKLCNSVEIVTEHRHLHEKDVSLLTKRTSLHENTHRLQDSNRMQHHSGPEADLCRRSVGNYSEGAHRNSSRKELQLSQKGSLNNIQRKPLWLDISAKHNQPPLQRTPATTRIVHDNISNPFLSNSIQTPKAHASHQYFKQTMTSPHNPHSVITRQKHNQPTASNKSFEGQKKSTKGKPSPKPNIETYWQSKKEEIIKNNSDFAALRRTVKKEPKFSCRDSDETASKTNSKCQKIEHEPENLKKACIFDRDKIKINLHTAEKGETRLIDPKSPNKVTKMLQDAKSICSLEASNSKVQDCLFEESVLIERDIDMFQFITPIAGILDSQIARAVDRREGNVVTLKFFNQGREKQCHKELELLQMVDGLGNKQFPLKILKFKETLIEDNPQKQIIFVYQSFQRLMSQQISLLAARGQNTKQFIDNFMNEVKIMLLLLSINGIALTQALKLEDFVHLGQDWRLHNVSKLRLGGCGLEGGHLAGWLQQLRDECCHLLSSNN